MNLVAVFVAMGWEKGVIFADLVGEVTFKGLVKIVLNHDKLSIGVKAPSFSLDLSVLTYLFISQKSFEQ